MLDVVVKVLKKLRNKYMGYNERASRKETKMDEVEIEVLSEDSNKSLNNSKSAIVLGCALVAGFIAAASTRREMTKVFFPNKDKD